MRDGDGEPCGILCRPSTRERDGAVGVSGMGLLRPMPSESVSPGNDGVDHGIVRWALRVQGVGESGTSERCTRVCGVRSIMLGDVASRLVGVGSQSGSVDGAK